MSMDEITPNFWVGDLPSALDTDNLRTHNIRSVLTAMRGRVSIHDTFIRQQINIDDTDTADILQHFLPAIAFIQAELDKGHGVLVHCQAGMSRSVALAAAYLMVNESLDPEAALNVIRKARPDVQPNEGFMRQLEIFHLSSFKVDQHDKQTRMFYLERVVNEVMNGDGEVETEMFAKFPRSPSDSAPQPRRRIRCKMCRQELAAREHMLDHGQLGPPTPAVLSAAPSRRPSINDAIKPTAGGPVARRTSAGGSRPIVGLPGMSRKPSTREPLPRSRLDSITEGRSLRSSLVVLDTTAEVGRSVSDLTDSAIDDGDSPDEEPPKSDSAEGVPSHAKLGADVAAAANDSTSFAKKATLADRAAEVMITPSLQPSQNLAHPSDLAAQLASHPKLSALCSPTGLAMTTMTPTVLTPQSPVLTSVKNYFQAPSPPILANPKCSGYFVEPMKWMEPFLEQGHMAGKIICPNKKCGVKLGNYDWAGVCCSCKEWVVPGFCIHRSKVDEMV